MIPLAVQPRQGLLRQTDACRHWPGVRHQGRVRQTSCAWFAGKRIRTHSGGQIHAPPAIGADVDAFHERPEGLGPVRAGLLTDVCPSVVLDGLVMRLVQAFYSRDAPQWRAWSHASFGYGFRHVGVAGQPGQSVRHGPPHRVLSSPEPLVCRLARARGVSSTWPDGSSCRQRTPRRLRPSQREESHRRAGSSNPIR